MANSVLSRLEGSTLYRHRHFCMTQYLGRQHNHPDHGVQPAPGVGGGGGRGEAGGGAGRDTVRAGVVMTVVWWRRPESGCPGRVEAGATSQPLS